MHAGIEDRINDSLLNNGPGSMFRFEKYDHCCGQSNEQQRCIG